MGRPTKLGSHIVSAFREILSEEMNVLACSDRELFAILNGLLPADGKVSYRTFQRYKAHAMAIGAEIEDCETEDEIAALEGFDPVYRTMYNLFTLALIKQKKVLLHRIIDEEQGWRRYQWLLERKYREWNLRWEPPVVEPPVIVVQKAPEPKPEPAPLLPDPVPYVEPEKFINGDIPEKQFRKELFQWVRDNNVVLYEYDIVECRFYDDGPVEYRVKTLHTQFTNPPEDACDYHFNDHEQPCGYTTARVWERLTRRTAPGSVVY